MEGNDRINVHENEQGRNDGRKIAKLMLTPHTINDLWQEYEQFGTCNRKPAKDFTSSERGQVKHTYYSMRKFLWEVVGNLVESGTMDAQVACDRVYYEVYGQNQSVTNIFKSRRMKRDKL